MGRKWEQCWCWGAALGRGREKWLRGRIRTIATGSRIYGCSNSEGSLSRSWSRLVARGGAELVFGTVLGVERSVSRRRKRESLWAPFREGEGDTATQQHTGLYPGGFRGPAKSAQSDFGSLTGCDGRDITNPNRRLLSGARERIGIGTKNVDDGGDIAETRGLGVADCLTVTTEVRGIAEQLRTPVSRLSWHG